MVRNELVGLSHGYLWEIEKYRKINSEAEEYFAESFGHSNK